MHKKLAVLLIAPLLMSQTVFGAGFALYEFSARGNAMAGATMANKAEPASIATNPALITQLTGTQVQTGLTAVTIEATTSLAGSERSLEGGKTWYLPNFFLTHQVSDDVFLGMGAFSRFGLGGKYKNYKNWPGSAMAYKVSLETVSLTPTLAVKMNEQFSIAMGLEAMVIGFSENAYAAAARNGYEISGSGISWGGNFSFLYRPEWAEQWALGAMYRTKIKQTLNGRVDSGLPSVIIASGDARGSISMPDSINAGISYQASEKLVLETGVIATFWSAYDQIMVEYKEGNYPPLIDKKNYQDSYRFNIGADYDLTKNWSVRAGYAYDKSPINTSSMDTLLPGDNRHLASMGVGYQQENWAVDISYTHLFIQDLKGTTNAKTGNLPIEYKNGSSNMYGLSFSYKF